MEETTEWKWEVKPFEKGRHNLHLSFTSIQLIDGVDTRIAIHNITENINVVITCWDHAVWFITSDWKWTWVSVVLPLISAIFIFIKYLISEKRKKTKGN